jgi:hypothetical protein
MRGGHTRAGEGKSGPTAWVLLAGGLAGACKAGDGAKWSSVRDSGDAPTEEPPEETGGIPEGDGWPFPTSELIEVELELDAADWEELRLQGRSLFEILGGDCLEEPFGNPYVWFEANLRVNGSDEGRVGLRKKGFIGSLSTEKPGLKIDMDRVEAGRRLRGLEKLTLNNTPQDGTMLRTCLGYEAFREMGVGASHCSFAHVVVNGQDLGIYANVEGVDEAMMERLTGTREVALFEGTLSDLRTGWEGTFEADSDEADPGLLEPMVEAVESGEYERIAEVVDLESFYRFWAAEALSGHWDGYNWNRNNFYLYIDPSDGKARFVPWGLDAVWSTREPGRGISGGDLNWIPLNSNLSLALIKDSRGEAAYRAELARQLDNWDAAASKERLGEWTRLLESRWEVPGGELRQLEGILEAQEEMLRSGLAEPAGEWPDEPADALCVGEIGEIELSFSGEYGSLTSGDWGSAGECALRMVYEGDETVLSGGSALIGDDGDGVQEIGCFWDLGGGVQLLPYFTIQAHDFHIGSLRTDQTRTYGGLFYASPDTGGRFVSAAWMEGDLWLDAARIEEGAPVSGGFQGLLWSPAW